MNALSPGRETAHGYFLSEESVEKLRCFFYCFTAGIALSNKVLTKSVNAATALVQNILLQ